MDLPSLVSVLQVALSTSEDRKLAEERLKQLQHHEGHLVRLLQVIVAPEVDIAVRQVASIHFKNVIARDWAGTKLPAADRPPIRNNLLEAIIHCPPIIRSQLGECLKAIVHVDYPDRWPLLLQSIDQNLRSQDQQRVSGALFALRILARKYEFKDEDERLPIYSIIDLTFPVLLEIFKYLLSLPNPSIEVADLIKHICKIYWSLTYLEIPKPLHDQNIFTSWMLCFLNLIERPVPLQGQPEAPEGRKQWGWWKVKKWALQIVNRLYNRFGDTKSSSAKTFSAVFQAEFAGKFLEAYLRLLGVLRQGGFLTDRVINLAIQYLNISVGKLQTYQILKSQMDVVLFEIIFPLLCFNSQDEELWRDDPHEYVRKGYDIIEDLYSPKTAAQNFISELVRRRTKDNLAKFVQFVVEVFRRYDAAPPNQKPYREKDGALLAVGSLSERLKQVEPYKSQLEQMLVQHVYPEFRSPAGHLRAKAAWVAGQYASINFSDPGNFTVALRSIMAALKDPELPVRVDSVVALRSFVEASSDLAEIRSILPQLLDDFFKLMNEVENEDLVVTLEAVVDKFGEEMAPYTLGLCQHLAAAFWKCLQSSEADGDDDDSGALAAVGCLRAIGTILESISGLNHLFPQLEPTLLPILQKMLTSEGQDVMEEVLEILSYMTYYSPSISLDMWSLWPLIMEALDEWAIDYFENILVPLDNYISRSTDHFLTCKNPDYQQRLFRSVSTILADEKLDDPEVMAGPKLIESVLQNCKGRVDEWVEPYLRISIDRLRKANKKGLKDLLMEVVANALYYNPALCLNILAKMGVTKEIFQLWFQMLYALKKSGNMIHFRRQHDKKVCILGLTSLLTLPAEAMPAELNAGFDQVFRAVLKLLIAFKKQVDEESKEQEEPAMEGWEDGDDDWEKDIDEDEDEDEVNTERLQRLVSKVKAFQRRDDDLDDLDDSDDDDFIEEEEFQAAIDSVDPFIFFADTVKGRISSQIQLSEGGLSAALSARDPMRFQAVTRSLDFQHQAMAHAVEQYVDARRKELLQSASSNNGVH